MQLQIKPLLVLFLLLALWSCRKKEYPPSVVENDPVYYTTVTVDGQNTTVRAGENNYYMYSSNGTDSTGLNNYLARLQPAGCDSCYPALSFQINDLEAGKNYHPDSSLAVRQYEYFNYLPVSSSSVIFSAAYSGTANDADYKWSFGDGSSATGKIVTHQFVSGGPTQVCLQVTGVNKCAASSCNTIDVSPGALNAYVQSVSNSTRSAGFTAQVSGGQAPYTYSWDFGDGSKGSGASIVHTFPYVGAYAVRLQVKDAAGKTSVHHYNYKTLTDNSSCAANVMATVLKPGTATAFEKKVRITYTDKSGDKYSSDVKLQGTDAHFEVLSSEKAGTNEKGEQMQKLKIRFGATVFSGTKSLKLENGEAVIAVSYK